MSATWFLVLMFTTSAATNLSTDGIVVMKVPMVTQAVCVAEAARLNHTKLGNAIQFAECVGGKP